MIDMRNIIIKFWNGEITLWKSYWLVGELINALVILGIYNLEIKFFYNNLLIKSIPFLNFNNFHLINKIILICWTFFITVGIWRSAEVYKGRLIWIVLTLLFLSYRIFTLRIILY